MAIDEAGDRAQPVTIDLLDVARERRKITHPADRLERAVPHEDERVLEHVHVAESAAAKRCLRADRRHHLGEVADEEPLRPVGRHGTRRHEVTPGRSSPPRRAASTASS